MSKKLDLKKIKEIDKVNGDILLQSHPAITPGWCPPHSDFAAFGLNMLSIIEGWCASRTERVVLAFMVGEDEVWVHFFPKEMSLGNWQNLPEDAEGKTKSLLEGHVELTAAWYLYFAKQQLDKFDEQKTYLELITSL